MPVLQPSTRPPSMSSCPVYDVLVWMQSARPSFDTIVGFTRYGYRKFEMVMSTAALSLYDAIRFVFGNRGVPQYSNPKTRLDATTLSRTAIGTIFSVTSGVSRTPPGLLGYIPGTRRMLTILIPTEMFQASLPS